MVNKSKNRKLSAGVVVVREDESTHELLLLLLRAYQYWDFPKGMQELGETEFEAALREVKEETTICDLDFCWGNMYFETGPYRGGKVARYYIAKTKQIEIELPINPELGRPEHVESRWVKFEEALKMCSPRVKSVINWARKQMDKK
ncbi:MAG: NUDIX domain-containing protein [Gammaproteobacteria bacterium]|nr:MAG: NUDIX domain-containing protein [Gammaproteobacteria bacterium]